MPLPGRIHPVQAFAALAFALSAGAAPGPFEGYWRRVGDADYASYLKVVADSGYRCVMDGKSSHRFRIQGDSITTPMNGKDAIVLLSPGNLRISGTEKGEDYHSDYARMEASAYPDACDEEEARWYGPTSLRGRTAGKERPAPRNSAVPGLLHRGESPDALGRLRPADRAFRPLPPREKSAP